MAQAAIQKEIVSGKLYAIRNKKSGLYLDVEAYSKKNGAKIHQWNWHGADNQLFYLNKMKYGWQIKNKGSGKVADIEGYSTNNGAKCHQWEWHGANNQLFEFVKLDDATYRINIVHDKSKCLDVSEYSTKPGAKIHQWQWHGGDNQRFYLERKN